MDEHFKKILNDYAHLKLSFEYVSDRYKTTVKEYNTLFNKNSTTDWYKYTIDGVTKENISRKRKDYANTCKALKKQRKKFMNELSLLSNIITKYIKNVRQAGYLMGKLDNEYEKAKKYYDLKGILYDQKEKTNSKTNVSKCNEINKNSEDTGKE